MKAYSYARFSSAAQRPGTSIARQQALAIKWCEDNNIVLSDDTFEDEAVSGFEGTNRKYGALANFIERVESDEIEKGSYLILEHLDRLTREHPWAAAELLQKLVKLGIIVITLKPEPKRYDGKSNAIDLLQAILYMDNAHNESVNKSNYGKGEWAKRFKRARETGHHIGARVSNWLTLDKLAGKYYVNEHAFAVGRIFELCLDGLGSTAISQALNGEGYRTFNKGGRWGTTAVLSILQNRAVLGELAPKDGGGSIADYFPAIIDETTFDAAYAHIKARKTGKVTKQSSEFNVWQKLVFCGECNSAMHIIQRAKFKYLMCASRRYGQCEGSKNVRLDESEDVFLLMLQEIDALHFAMPDPERLTRELKAAEGKLLAERDTLAIWTERLGKNPTSETFANFVLQTESRIITFKGHIERLTAELLGSGDNLNLAAVRAKVDMRDMNMRRRANAFLHRLGVQVHVAEGYLVTQRDEARAMIAVAKNRIGCMGLESEPGDTPDPKAANALAQSVKNLLSTPHGGFVYRGTLTVPNGRGTRQKKPGIHQS